MEFSSARLMLDSYSMHHTQGGGGGGDAEDARRFPAHPQDTLESSSFEFLCAAHPHAHNSGFDKLSAQAHARNKLRSIWADQHPLRVRETQTYPPPASSRSYTHLVRSIGLHAPLFMVSKTVWRVPWSTLARSLPWRDEWSPANAFYTDSTRVPSRSGGGVGARLTRTIMLRGNSSE